MYIKMNNSTTFAATIGFSALGVLAYYGYQNINKETETQLYNEVDNVDETTTDLQDKAKDEVKKVIENVTGSWSGFWKNEYNDINKDEKVAEE
jgi:uncharacterized membrane protein YebE (DUF533 family)